MHHLPHDPLPMQSERFASGGLDAARVEKSVSTPFAQTCLRTSCRWTLRRSGRSSGVATCTLAGARRSCSGGSTQPGRWTDMNMSFVIHFLHPTTHAAAPSRPRAVAAPPPPVASAPLPLSPTLCSTNQHISHGREKRQQQLSPGSGIQRDVLQPSSTPPRAAWSVWESGSSQNPPSAATSEGPSRRWNRCREPSPRVSWDSSWSASNQHLAVGWALSMASEPGPKVSDHRAAGLLRRTTTVS